MNRKLLDYISERQEIAERMIKHHLDKLNGETGLSAHYWIGYNAALQEIMIKKDDNEKEADIDCICGAGRYADVYDHAKECPYYAPF